MKKEWRKTDNKNDTEQNECFALVTFLLEC